MTVSELRKLLKNMDGRMQVYAADHDHSDWETNGPVRSVEIVEQSKMDSYAKEYLNRFPEYKIRGKYVCLRVG